MVRDNKEHDPRSTLGECSVPHVDYYGEITKKLEQGIGQTLYDFFLTKVRHLAHPCLMGYGMYGKRILHDLLATGNHVDCVCDNNWQALVSAGAPIPVLSVEQAVAESGPECVFVITTPQYALPMAKQLLELGIPFQHILAFDMAVTAEYHAQLPHQDIAEVVSLMHQAAGQPYPAIQDPVTYNEHIMHDMIQLPQPKLFTLLADKLRVRDWVAERIGGQYLVPLVGAWASVDNVPFESLPKRCVLKANHGSGWNIIVNEEHPLDIAGAKAKLGTWLHTNFAYLQYEMQYRDIPPRIICEEYLDNGEDIYDYKVFCFHGRPQYVMFLCNRQKGLEMAFYDLEWHKMPFVYSYLMYQGKVPRPARLTEMLNLSEKLAQGLAQVRVDWYIPSDGSLRFGEMTLTSCAGHADWRPAEWDRKLGEMMDRCVFESTRGGHTSA